MLTVGDPYRFEKSRSVGAYLGHVPARDRSGEKDPHKRISRKGDETLRKLLVGNSHYIRGPFGSDSDLTAGSTKAIGPWDLLVDENHLYAGGHFTEVRTGGSVVNQNAFVRFTFAP